MKLIGAIVQFPIIHLTISSNNKCTKTLCLFSVFSTFNFIVLYICCFSWTHTHSHIGTHTRTLFYQHYTSLQFHHGNRKKGDDNGLGCFQTRIMTLAFSTQHESEKEARAWRTKNGVHVFFIFRSQGAGVGLKSCASRALHTFSVTHSFASDFPVTQHQLDFSTWLQSGKTNESSVHWTVHSSSVYPTVFSDSGKIVRVEISQTKCSHWAPSSVTMWQRRLTMKERKHSFKYALNF